MTPRTSRIAVRTALGCLLATVLAVFALATGTYSSFTTAKIANSNDTTASSLLKISHSYQSSICSATQAATLAVTSCSSSVYPSAAATTAASQVDTISNNGTTTGSSMTTYYRVASCGPVDLDNSVSGSDNGPLLPRTGTTFAPTTGPAAGFGSIGLDGITGYASSVSSSVEPIGPTGAGTDTYGMGVWFKTSSTAVNPLFGFGSAPLDSQASNDRVLYLDGTGKIGFIPTTAATSATTGTAAGVTKYDDGVWHFAWVSLSVTSTRYTITVYVDNKVVTADTKTVTGRLGSYTGYWHLGTATVSSTARHFAGSLSDFVVDDSGAAPTTPGANPTSPTSFDSAHRTELWTLDDSGGSFDGTTTDGTLPAGTTLPSSAGDPCASVTITWMLTSPAATIANGATLAAQVSAGYVTVTANPDPADTQISTITLKRATTVNSYLSGLILYAPVVAAYTVGPTASWAIAFAWNAPAAGSVNGSTFVIQ